MYFTSPPGCPPGLTHFYHNLERLISLYHQWHNKMLVVRADLHYPLVYPPVHDNLHIQRCMAKIIQFLKRAGYDPAYSWVREQVSSIHPHYHCLFLLDGQKTRSCGLVFDNLSRFWASTIASNAPGLVHYCIQDYEQSPYQNGQIIQRGQEIPQNIFWIMNYFAKEEGKGEPNDGLRNFGMSRLKNLQQTPSERQEGN